jgi:hypothetical protein
MRTYSVITLMECLILNLDWQKNPIHFVYKLDNEGDLDTDKEMSLIIGLKLVGVKK